MLLDQLKPNIIVRGPIFPEPVQVIVAIPMGTSVKLVGKGLNTNRVHEPILNAKQLAQLQSTPEKEPFDGDPVRFRLGVRDLSAYFHAHERGEKEKILRGGSVVLLRQQESGTPVNLFSRQARPEALWRRHSSPSVQPAGA